MTDERAIELLSRAAASVRIAASTRAEESGRAWRLAQAALTFAQENGSREALIEHDRQAAAAAAAQIEAEAMFFGAQALSVLVQRMRASPEPINPKE